MLNVRGFFEAKQVPRKDETSTVGFGFPLVNGSGSRMRRVRVGAVVVITAVGAVLVAASASPFYLASGSDAGVDISTPPLAAKIFALAIMTAALAWALLGRRGHVAVRWILYTSSDLIAVAARVATWLTFDLSIGWVAAFSAVGFLLLFFSLLNPYSAVVAGAVGSEASEESARCQAPVSVVRACLAAQARSKPPDTTVPHQGL